MQWLWRTGWLAREWRGLRKEVHFRHCSVTSCSTNSTGSWSAGVIVSFDMRTTVISTFAASGRAGQRVMESITRFITQKLKLKVNEAKSAVARPQERKFLGFSFTAGPEVKRVIAPKALDRFKRRIREITGRAKGVSMKTTMEELAPYMRGWRSYFGFCETPEVLIGLTRWVRLRLRAALWRPCKTPRRHRAALVRRGRRERLGGKTAGRRGGPGCLATATTLCGRLSNAYFKSLGLPSFFEQHYRNPLHPPRTTPTPRGSARALRPT